METTLITDPGVQVPQRHVCTSVVPTPGDEQSWPAAGSEPVLNKTSTVASAIGQYEKLRIPSRCAADSINALFVFSPLSVPQPRHHQHGNPLS